MPTVRERRQHGDSANSGGMTVRKQRLVNENKQYADAMKSSRLQEVKNLNTAKKAVVENFDRSDRMMSTVDSSKLRNEVRLQTNANRADVNLSPVESANTRSAIHAQDMKAAADKAAYAKLPKIRRVIADAINSPIGRRIMKGNEITSDVLRRGLDSYSVGVTDAVDKALIKSPLMDAKSKEVIQSNRERSLHSTAGKVGTVVGYLGPGALVDRLVVTAGKAALTKLPKVARGLIRGAAAGTLDTAAQEGGDVAFRGGKFDPLNIAIGGTAGGVLGAAGPLIGKAFRSFMNRGRTIAPEVEQRVAETLALPAPRQRGNINAVDTPDVIYGTGRVHTPEPLALPQGNVVRPTRLQPASNNAVLDGVMQRIKPVVNQRMTPPLENPNELAKWVRDHFGDPNLSLNEVRKLPYEQLRQMAEMMRSRLNVEEEAHKAASEMGYNLSELLNGKLPTLGQRVARNAQERTYGVYPESLPNVRTPQFNRQVVSGVAAPVERVGRAPDIAEAPTSVKGRREAQQPQQAPATVRAKREAQTSPNPIDSNGANSPIEQEAEQILQTVQQPRVRDRVYSYLDEAEKAARDRIAKSGNRLSSTPVDMWTDYAIIGAAKLGKGSVKLADFTEEMVKDFGEHIRPHAQRIYSMAKEQLKQQGRRASKEGQDAATFNESGIGNASTFEQKISRQPSKIRQSWGQKWQRMRTQMVDDLAPLEGLEKRVRGRVASAEDSLYKAARMFKGVPEKAGQIVTKQLTPIIATIEKAGYSADDLGRYALAKHAKDVNAAGYKSGFTNAEIESVLIKYHSPEMEAAQKALVQVNQDMLKELVDNGVVSKELATVLNERWKNYIPLFRALEDDAVAFEDGLSKALANVASPIKALKGSEKAVIDPLENMVKNIFRSTNASERNKVASQLPKLAQIDTEANFIRRLDPHEEVGRKNVVNVKVDGENVKYEVEPEVYKALLNLDQESSNMLINVLSKPASLLRAGATLTPEFSLRNPMRDINQAFTVSKSGFNPLVDFPVGIVQAIAGRFGKGKLYQEWVNELGAYGNVMSMDRNVHRQALQKVLGESASKKFVNIVSGKSLISLLRAISDTTESATKIGEYRAALRMGDTRQEAAYRSRDIMDFARAGTAVRPANKVIAFLNANIQGNSKLIRAFKENPVGTTTRAFASVTLPTVGVFMMQKYVSNEKQKETIDNAPEWQKQAFWLIPVPGSDYVARLPKPFGLNLVFANPVEHALNFFYNKDKEAFDGFAGETLQGLTIPTQISGLLPIYEGMSNYSFFRQGDIIPMREQSLPYGDQYDPVRTTETAKLLASGVEKLTGGKGGFKNFSSPRTMDNTIQGLTAGLGKYATDAVDSILMGKVPFTGIKVSKPLIKRPEAPSQRLEQRPFVRSFLVDSGQGGKVMDEFYSGIDKLSKEKASNKYNDRTFGGTKKKPLYLEQTKEDALKALNKTSDSVSDINKQIRSIEKSMNLTAQQKRQDIETLTAQRMQMIKEAVSLFK